MKFFYKKTLATLILVTSTAALLPAQVFAQPALGFEAGGIGPNLAKELLNDVSNIIKTLEAGGHLAEADKWRAWEKAAREFLAKTPCGASGITQLNLQNLRQLILDAIKRGDVDQFKKLNLFEFLKSFESTKYADEATKILDEVLDAINNLPRNTTREREIVSGLTNALKKAEEEHGRRIAQELGAREAHRIAVETSKLSPAEQAALRAEAEREAERIVARKAAQDKLKAELASRVGQAGARRVAVGAGEATATGVGLRGPLPVPAGAGVALGEGATQTGVGIRAIGQQAAQKTTAQTAVALAEQAAVQKGAANIIRGTLAGVGIAIAGPALAAYGAGSTARDVINAVSEGIEGMEDAARQVLGEVARANNEINQEIPRYQEAIAKAEAELAAAGSRYRDAQNAFEAAKADEQTVLNDPNSSSVAKVAAQLKAGEAERRAEGLKSQIDGLESDIAVFKGVLKADQQKQKELQAALNLMQEALGLPTSELHQVEIVIPGPKVSASIRGGSNNFLVTASGGFPIIMDFAQIQCPPATGVGLKLDPRAGVASIIGPLYTYTTIGGKTYGVDEKIPYSELNKGDMYLSLFSSDAEFVGLPQITGGLTVTTPQTIQEAFPSLVTMDDKRYRIILKSNADFQDVNVSLIGGALAIPSELDLRRGTIKSGDRIALNFITTPFDKPGLLIYYTDAAGVRRVHTRELAVAPSRAVAQTGFRSPLSLPSITQPSPFVSPRPSYRPEFFVPTFPGITSSMVPSFTAPQAPRPIITPGAVSVPVTPTGVVVPTGNLLTPTIQSR
jgi:hypothetical protein